ncbi:MAG: glycosyltransferase family 2 protein, partial [Desulfuromonadales bacterium]|nr:glycosyltransferase family 2 protein [Desulfuromonadales bacterium]
MISVVTTLYRSAPYLDEFYRRVKESVAAISDDYEIVMVNDGSPDDSLTLAIALSEQDSRVKVIDLSRNFGHHNAIVAGLNYARGDYVFLIDVDLEEQPEWLAGFYQELHDSDADLVYGVQSKRKGGLLKGNFTGLFYTCFNLLSETKVPKNSCTVRLMRRRYLDALLSLKESSLFLAGSFSWAGFHQKEITVEKSLRQQKSSYNVFRMLKLLMNAVIGFSSFPLVLAFVCGTIISLVSGLIGGGLFVRKLFLAESLAPGWTSVMVSLWFLGGLMIFFVGLVGLYLSKTYLETKRRPLYLVRE